MLNFRFYNVIYQIFQITVHGHFINEFLSGCHLDNIEALNIEAYGAEIVFTTPCKYFK